MSSTRHQIRVRLVDSRVEDPHDGGLITVEGEPYALDKERALELALASSHLDLDAPGGTIRWKGTLVPREHFVRLEADVETAALLPD